ncbi:Histidine ammonia-lyase [Gossypium australe]|uniref:Histidine ammonia-lyase n=1 Tax=Gossypium australe TaxID=47621 RepID=A0A5B6WGM7_9ROSI|nr:Histidine ammonia-lyase [Gossypium australe]
MRNWYTEYIQANPNAQPPPPLFIPQPASVAHQVVEVVRRERPPGAEEFRASKDDDPERAEFWLENTIRVFDELSCTPEECIKCVPINGRTPLCRWYQKRELTRNSSKKNSGRSTLVKGLSTRKEKSS